jgi:hypothetical protein
MLKINNLIILKKNCLSYDKQLWVLKNRYSANDYAPLALNSCCLITNIYYTKNKITLFKFETNKIIEFLLNNQFYYYYDLKDDNNQPLWCNIIS